MPLWAACDGPTSHARPNPALGTGWAVRGSQALVCAVGASKCDEMGLCRSLTSSLGNCTLLRRSWWSARSASQCIVCHQCSPIGNDD